MKYNLILTRRLGVEGEEGVRDEMAGQHHHLSGHELGQTLGDGEEPGRLQFMGSLRAGHD